MSGLSVFRLVGNVSVNGGYGVAEVAEFGLPAHMIKTGRFTNDRLPLEPQITGNLTPSANSVYSLGNAAYQWRDLHLGGEVTGNLTPSANVTYSLGSADKRWKDLHIGGEVTGNLTPSANVTYDLGSADKRWKDLYLSGNTLYLGNTVISTSTVGNTTDLVIDGSRTIQTVGRTLADSYSASYSTNTTARPDLVQTSVAANTANVVVSTWTTQRSAVDNGWHSVVWAPELGIFCAVSNSGTGNRVMTSPDGINWTIRTSAADNSWLSVCWAPELSLFVAVAITGTGDRVMTSPDGIMWTAQTSAADNQWLSVTWAPELGLFVAVAQSGTGDRVMTSPDGINWTSRTSAADNQWRSVVWTSELRLFVVVARTGTGNRVMTSPDGITWTLRTSAADNNWFSVVWAPELGLFVAVANSGTGDRVMTSPDGINWTSRTSAADNQWRSVVWASELGIFTAVSESGTGNRVMTSPDGINWTIRTSAANNNWTSVCWSPELGIFAAVAQSGTGNRVMTSASALSTRIVGATSFVGSSVTIDGNDLLTTRDVRVTYPSEAPHGVTAGYSGYTGKKPALFRATTLSAVEAVSTWRAQASAVDNNWLGVCWAAELGLFCAVANSGTGNRVMTSSDGINWTARTSAADNNWVSVVWAPEPTLFAAVANTGTGNRVMTSPNGINWTARTSATDNNWRYVTWAAELGLFVAVSDNGSGNRVMTSPDGITWTSRTSAADNQWRSVVWAAELGLFVAVANTGTGNRVMTSPDGVNWTLRTTNDNNWFDVCWSPELSLFVAVAYSGIGNRVMTSPNGIAWTARASAADNDWLSVTWASELGVFVAVGQSGTDNRVMTSPDGINWTSRTSAADNNWRSVCWAPELGIFCVVSNSGTGNRVMTSRSALQLEAAGEATFKNAVVVPKLGVGTSSPGTALDVQSGFIRTAGETLAATSAGMPNIRMLFRTNYSRNWGWASGVSGELDGFVLVCDGGGNVRRPVMYIGSSGETGIGLNNTAPAATLDVKGTCRIDNNPAVNTAHSTSGYNFLTLASGNAIQGWGKGSNAVAGIFTVDPTNAGWSNAASILYLSKSTSTNRSINAAGTVNVNGADYAEYMKKCGNGDFTIAKGDVVGVDADGFLTDVYDDAVTFVIKSTDPSFVGGDTWGSSVGQRPTEPATDAEQTERDAYEIALAEWNEAIEAARASVDRIAFSGQVPVNVYGATPGDYIVPVRNGTGISAIAVPDASITFEQYRKAVGKVVKILDEDGGRAFVIVKIA